MESFWRKKKTDILFWFLLLVGYLGTRLFNLGLIPIFTDEAIYLRWSQIMAYDASLRFLPLVDGKPPLFMWLAAVGIRILPILDPLLIGRLVSVGAGLLGLLGVYFTSFQLFRNKAISYLSSLFYILVPFTLFYDRFGLADALLAALGVWSLGIGVIMVRGLRLDAALILGIIIGLGLLTKMPALFFLVNLVFLLLLFDGKRKGLGGRLLKLGGLLAVVVASSQAIFSILRLFPLFHMISQKNAEFVVPFSEVLRDPLFYFFGNGRTLVFWEIGYLTPLVATTVVIGIVWGLRKYRRETIILVSYFLIHLLYMSIFNKSIFPRFLLTFTPMLLILGAVGVDWATRVVKKKLLVAGCWLLVFAFPLYTGFKLLTDPARAPIPDGDSNQYINAWPAGYGVRELRQFFAGACRKYDKITVGTEGTFGLMPYALQIYQKEYPCLLIKDYWPLPNKIPPEMEKSATEHLTYFVIYQRQTEPEGWKLEKVARYQQGVGRDYLRLYRVLTE